MIRNPYDVLGVAKDASQDDIRKAFRTQAKKLHPDVNPGDKVAEQKFREISTAYDIIGDKEKRGRFDRGEIGPDGAERPQANPHYAGAGAGAGGPFGGGGGRGRHWSEAEFADFGNPEDVFSDFFSRHTRSGRMRMRGGDIRSSLDIDFLDAINGATKQLGLPDGSSVEVRIPAGTRDGQTLRLKGKGTPGTGGGEAGDLLIQIGVRPHPVFTRDGDNIRLDLPISLSEAVLGGSVTVPTPRGSVTLKIPANSSSGKVLRLKGRGVEPRGGKAGDAYVTLKIVLPDTPDPDLKAFVEGWEAGKAHSPRR